MSQYLFTIAIDDYKDPHFNNLNNAKTDITRFEKVLIENYHFAKIKESLFDSQATRTSIIEDLNSLTDLITTDDSLIIYFAGHGFAHPTTTKGFWIPHDASNSIGDFIPNSTIIDVIEGLSAKHILLISDSCFAGTFITQTRSGYSFHPYSKLNSTKSRWILASGREEIVGDGPPGKGSPFAVALCEFFEQNIGSTILCSDIFTHVLKYTSEQAPQQAIVASIANCGHEGGMIVFRPEVDIEHAPSDLAKLLVDFDLAMKLKDAGIEQNSVFDFYEDNGSNTVEFAGKPGKRLCSAYSAQELNDMIPEQIDIDTNTHLAHLTGYDQLSGKDIAKYYYAEVTVQRTDKDELASLVSC